MNPTILQLRQRLALQTRMLRDVVNEINREPPPPGYKQAILDLIKKHPNTRPRSLDASFKYDCHGLTFAARRTNIGSDQVSWMRDEDDYEEVSQNNVLPGDIVIYKSPKGELHHSGIVVSENKSIGGPWIVSKWGECHEVLHLLYDCPYTPSTVNFYRVRP